ncbi:hypothetical protein PG991_010952 [Apiospora marii]|uniref:Uncharacterized protein n=1 Tax=Apiospora marii TaxID=335849 RepID=A0ABR1REU1_9PEZI
MDATERYLKTSYFDTLAIFDQFYQKEEPAASESAAQALAEKVTGAPAPYNALDCIHWDLLKFGYQHPQSIDWSLRIYHRMCCGLLPADMRDKAHQNHSWMLSDAVRTYNGPFSSPSRGEIGNNVVDRDWAFEGPEYANLTFRRDEVLGENNRLGEAAKNVLAVRQARYEAVIDRVVEGRATALGVFGKILNYNIQNKFECWLMPGVLGHDCMWPWSKADFVAGCLGIRAAAKTFLDPSKYEPEKDLKLWKEGLAEFLLEGDRATDDEHKIFRDGDFLVKYHASNNITRSP